MMFTLYRYLKIEYPENLAMFFKSVESFQFGLSITRPKYESQNGGKQTATHGLNILGQNYQLYNQLANSKFAHYNKSSSFLLNGVNPIVTILSSIGCGLAIV